mgnify:CR=1 FL=1
MAITKLKVDVANADPFAIYNDYWDKPVPDLAAIPDPERYYMIVRQVGKKRKIGSIILSEQTVADQDWTHGAAVVVKLGPSVYRGRKYEDMGLTPADAPQPGTLVMFEARSPKRIKIDGELYLIIADDATFARPSLAELGRLAFTI